MIADRESARLYFDFEIFHTIFCVFVDIRNDSKTGLDFIRNILQQSLGVLYTDNISGVIHSDVHRAALCIGKTTEPFQILVPPRLFIFYILSFGHSSFPPKYIALLYCWRHSNNTDHISSPYNLRIAYHTLFFYIT